MGNISKITKSLFFIFVLISLVGCSYEYASSSSSPTETTSSNSLKIPKHYTIEKKRSGSSSAQSWSATVNAEIKKGGITKGSITQTWSDVLGSKQTCTGVYTYNGDICWVGSCEGYDTDRVTNEKSNFNLDNQEWKCSRYAGYSTPEGETIETYGEILVIIEESVAKVNKGEALSSYGKITGQDQLPSIYSKKKGCNEVICFENGYLSYFSIGSRYKRSWTISVIG